MDLDAARDIAIIVMAIGATLASLAVLIAALIMIGVLRTISREAMPVLKSAGDTMNTVRGTTKFVADVVIRPVVAVAVAVRVIARFVQVVARR